MMGEVMIIVWERHVSIENEMNASTDMILYCD